MVSIPIATTATSSRQKSGMSGTTRPQTRWEAIEERRNTSLTNLLGCLEQIRFPSWCAHRCGLRGSNLAVRVPEDAVIATVLH